MKLKINNFKVMLVVVFGNVRMGNSNNYNDEMIIIMDDDDNTNLVIFNVPCAHTFRGRKR